MTPRQAKLVDAANRVNEAALALEMDFPRADLDNPMVPPARRELIAIRQRDVASLRLASATVMAIAADPDAFGKLIELRAKKPAEFDAIMVLVQIELDRKPLEPARDAA